jgi:hypothetical protein
MVQSNKDNIEYQIVKYIFIILAKTIAKKSYIINL